MATKQGGGSFNPAEGATTQRAFDSTPVTVATGANIVSVPTLCGYEACRHSCLSSHTVMPSPGATSAPDTTLTTFTLPSDPTWCEVRITEERLDLAGIAERVTHPSAGGISIFVGTTRDHHGGKGVACLEYEAYKPLALAEMRRIAHEAFAGVGRGQLTRIILHHRLGIVPVTEASVIIAVSSPHRAEALAATDYLIHRLKARVPVWKKEVYTDGTSNWKENCECAWSSSVASTVGATACAVGAPALSAPAPASPRLRGC